MRQIKNSRYTPNPLDRVLNLLELERADRLDSKAIREILEQHTKDIAELTGMVEMLFKMVKEIHKGVKNER
jgi:hypothetical protein